MPSQIVEKNVCYNFSAELLNCSVEKFNTKAKIGKLNGFIVNIINKNNSGNETHVFVTNDSSEKLLTILSEL